MSAVASDNKNVFAQDTHRPHKLFTYNPKTEVSLNTKWNRIWKVAEIAGSVAIVAFGLLAIHFTAVHYAIISIVTFSGIFLGVILFDKTSPKVNNYASQAKFASQMLEKMNGKRDDSYWSQLLKRLNFSSDELDNIKNPEKNRLPILARYDILYDSEARLQKTIDEKNKENTKTLEALKQIPFMTHPHQVIFSGCAKNSMDVEELKESLAHLRLEQAFLLKIMIDCEGKPDYSDYFLQSKKDFSTTYLGRNLPQDQIFLLTQEKRFTVEDILNTPIRTLAEEIFELPKFELPKKGFFGLGG
ncbi:MAG: hypothetical protein K1000chlam2_00150 [Chlamydiae bacterium]|nr:hypothetical protein [Chlamydiota bacterium]